MTFKELKAAVKGRFMNWGKYTAEKLENVSSVFESTKTTDEGKVLTVSSDGSPAWEEVVNPLPPVTAEDNGDVLSVVDGAWSKAPAPSSLPPYTSADKGKGLFLGEGSESETVVAVPEQTVTVVDRPVQLVDADVSCFVVGYTGVMTVNETDYNVTAFDEEGAIIYGGDGIGFMIAYYNGSVLCQGVPNTYTVSLSVSVPSVKPKWEGVVLSVTATDDVIEGESCIVLDKTGAEIEAAFPFVVVSYGREHSIVVKYKKTTSHGDTLYSVTTMPMATQLSDLVFENAPGESALIYYLPA